MRSRREDGMQNTLPSKRIIGRHIVDIVGKNIKVAANNRCGFIDGFLDRLDGGGVDRQQQLARTVSIATEYFVQISAGESIGAEEASRPGR